MGCGRGLCEFEEDWPFMEHDNSQDTKSQGVFTLQVIRMREVRD